MSQTPSLRARALRYLARREHTRAELENKLAGQAGDESDLASVLDELTRGGFLSDQRALENLISARRGKRGAARIVHDLRSKGVGEELIAAALPALKAGETEAARDVWQRKFGALPQNASERARQMRFLQSRGFDFETIRVVLRGAEADR
ncbi:MAG: recombination regulator RecX [Burkholderiales bacterium]|nr:recombination regulator RecX [Burkholderiales bacterium]